ncbi:MAG: MFS transporter [Promethearchaeota archaeon]
MSEINNENYENNIEDMPYKENPWYIKASYGSREMFGQWITIVFGSFGIFFYKQVIGLDVGLTTAAFIIWSIWNAVNDPLTGYLMEKLHMPWEKKKGFRRFPWIVLGAIPWLFSYLMIYLVPLNWDPVIDRWKIFIWLLVSLCLYDLFYTLYDVNAISLYPIKFQSQKERRSAQMFGTLLGILGLSLGFTIPTAFMGEGAKTYQTAAWVSVIGGVILFSFMLPGVFEDKRLRLLNLQRSKHISSEVPQNFLKSAREVFSNRRFVMKVIFFFGYQASVALINGSAAFIVAFIIRKDMFVVLMAAMLGGALLSVPLWLYIGNKLNDNKKTSILGAICMILSYIPMIFVTTPIGWILALFLFGAGLGGQWFMDPPTMGDVLDDIAVKTGKRQQSIYYGYQSFIIRFGEAFKAITIGLAHYFTHLPSGVETYDELVANTDNVSLAIFGIRIHTAIVPMILVIIATFLFWKYYDLTPEVVAENKKKLTEMNL